MTAKNINTNINNKNMGENRDQVYFDKRIGEEVEINGKKYKIESAGKKDGKFVYDLKEQGPQTQNTSEYKDISAEMLDSFLKTEELSENIEKIKTKLKLKNREIFEKIQKMSLELVNIDKNFIGKNSEIENWSKIKAGNISVEIDKIQAEIKKIEKELEKIEKGELVQNLHDKLKEKVFEDKKNQMDHERKDYQKNLKDFKKEKEAVEKRKEEVEKWIADNKPLFDTTKTDLEKKAKQNKNNQKGKIKISDSEVIQEIINKKLATPDPLNFLTPKINEPKEPKITGLDLNDFTDNEKNEKYFKKLGEISENKNNFYDTKMVELAKEVIEEMEKLSGGVKFEFKNLNKEAKKEVFGRAEKIFEKLKKENLFVFDSTKEISKMKKEVENKYKDLIEKEIEDPDIKKKLEDWKVDFDSFDNSEDQSLELLKRLQDLELEIVRKKVDIAKEKNEETDKKEVEKPETKEIDINPSIIEEALKNNLPLAKRIEGYILEGIFSDRPDLAFGEATSAIEELFDVLKTDTPFLDSLKKAGFPNYESFIKRFKEGKMAEKTAKVMQEWMNTEIQRIAMIEGGFFSAFKDGKLKQNWKNMLKIAGVWGGRIGLTIGAVGGGMFLFGYLGGAAVIGGGLTGAATGGAIGGLIRRGLNKFLDKMGFDKALQSGVKGIKTVEQKAQMEKIKKDLEKNTDKQAREFSILLAESLRQESLKGVEDESETVETKDLKSDAKKVYIDYLKRAREQGKEVNEKDRYKLIEILQVMQQKDELKMEEINKLASGTAEFLDDKISSFFKALSGKVEGRKGDLAAMSAGATVGASFWADNSVARMVLGGLGGASLGYKFFGKGNFEKKMEKEVKVKYDAKIAEYDYILKNDHLFTVDQMRKVFEAMEKIYEGNDKENLDLTYYLNQHPQEKVKLKQKLLLVSNLGWLEDKTKKIVNESESRLTKLESLVVEKGKETDKFVKEQVKKWKKENGQKIEDSKVTAVAVTVGAVGMAAFSFAVGVGVQHLKAEYLSGNSDTNIAPGNTEKVVGAAVGAKVISENINSGATPETVSPGSGDTAIADKPVDSESITGSEAKESVTDTSSQEEVPETKEEVLETKEKTVEEPPDEQKPKNEEIYKIQKGDGYNDVFKRQIGADPEKFGYKEGDDLDKFINNKAKEFLKMNNLWKNGKGVGLRYDPEAKIVLNEDGSLVEEGVKTYKMEIPKVEKVPAPVEQEQIKDGDVPEKTEPVLSQKEVMASKVEEAIARLEAVKESNSALYKTFTKQIELGYSEFNQSGDVADLEKTLSTINEVTNTSETETINSKTSETSIDKENVSSKGTNTINQEEISPAKDKAITDAETHRTKGSVKLNVVENKLSKTVTDNFRKIESGEIKPEKVSGELKAYQKEITATRPYLNNIPLEGDKRAYLGFIQEARIASEKGDAVGFADNIKKANELYEKVTGGKQVVENQTTADTKNASTKESVDEIGKTKTETTGVEEVKLAHTEHPKGEYVVEIGDTFDKKGNFYEAFSKGDKVVFKNSFDILYDRNGNRIGFVGKDKAFHFHDPADGYPKNSLEKVGIIRNKYEGQGNIKDFSNYKSPLDKETVDTNTDKTGEPKNYKEETLPKEQAKFPEEVKDEYQYTKSELAEIKKANEYLDRLEKTDGIKADDWKWDMKNLTGEEKIDLAKHILNSEKADLETMEDAKIASDREQMRIANEKVYGKMLKEKMKLYDDIKTEEVPKAEQSPEEQKNTESPNKHRAETLKAINAEDEKPVEKMIEEDIEENKSDMDNVKAKQNNIKAEQAAIFENRGAGAIAEITKNFSPNSSRFGGPELREEFETLQDIYKDAVKNGKAGDLEAVAEQLEGLRDYQNFVNSKSNIQEVIRYNNNMVSLEERDMSGKFGNLYRTGEALGKKWTDSSDLFDAKGLKSTVKEMAGFNKEFEEMTVGEREPEMTK